MTTLRVTRGRAFAFGLAALAVFACQRPGAESAQGGALPPLPPVAEGELRPLSVFTEVSPEPVRSQALFVEASRVLLHPRCTNCHVAGDSPTQGVAAELHEPPLVRGPEGDGVVGMHCRSCHSDDNAALSRVPGAPGWRLPPASMAWVDKSAREVCEQIQDPARNGNKTLEQIAEHSGHDALVAWGWAPGAHRTRPPGTQRDFALLMQAWIETGAHCPPEGVTP